LITLVVNAANTTTTASDSAPAGGITYGHTDTVGFNVSSSEGVTGQTATGTAAVVKDSGPGALNCLDTEGTPTGSPAVSASETTGSGFSFAADGTHHSTLQLVCTPDAAGAYTFHVHFTDADGSYNGSSSSPLITLVVNAANTTTTASDSAPAGGITYGHTDTVGFNVSSSEGVTGQTATGTAA